MARDRTHDEILDQMVYAVACVAYHYGPGLSGAGLRWVRKQLDREPQGDPGWWCDSSWRVDIPDGEELDFCPEKLPPDLLDRSFEEIVRLSRGGEEQ